MLRGFAKVTCYHSFLFLLILFKNKDPVLKYFLSFHDRIMHFSFNLLMWLEPFPGVEFLAQWFTHKTLWIGSRESNMPGHNAIRAWLTHKKALRKDRWWDIMDLTTSGSGAYLNYSTNLTNCKYSQVKDSLMHPGSCYVLHMATVSYFCSLSTYYICMWAGSSLSRSDSRKNTGTMRKEKEICLGK